MQIHHSAARVAEAFATAVEPACALGVNSGKRWIGELTMERRRAGVTTARWTETRTLDLTEGAASLRLSASYLIETGEGTQSAEWRLTPDGTYLATAAADGDLWVRRDTGRNERAQLLGLGPGSLQALLDGVDGWKQTPDGWTIGTEPLRCSDAGGRAAFIDRFVASTKPTDAALRVTTQGRTFDARWTLSDQSTLTAKYEDRVVPFDGVIETPADVVPTARDRSLFKAQQLLEKLAGEGLADVASSAPEPVEAQ